MFTTFVLRSFPASSHNLKAMKKYTHAWLATMALKRLRHAEMNPVERTVADSLLKWLNNHRDSVIKRAWYPDSITQYSFLTAYQFIPADYNHTNLTWFQFQTLTSTKFDQYSQYLLSDSVDTISRVWLRL